MTRSATLASSNLPLKLVRRGKVREVYAVDDATLLLVASDRVSAFDVVMKEAIPRKGAVLTQMSAYWFTQLRSVFPNHFITADAAEILKHVPALAQHKDQVTGRAMLVQRTEPIAFECVVRGYLSGSAWAEYKKSGTLAGEPLAQGLKESSKLNPPIFSPATKAETGHDENITYAALEKGVGKDMAATLLNASRSIYEAGRDRAALRGIIIADTKFEFGRAADGTLILIDEVLTPDSSRFWPADMYQEGRGQPSFDKQPLRDYLDGLKRNGQWDGNAPPPDLPHEVVRATSIRYQDAFMRVTGDRLKDDA